LRPFVPFFRHRHLLTIAGNFWPRAIDEARFPTNVRTYATEPGTQVLVKENRPVGPPRGEVFLQHGLEGSCDSGYMISLAQELLQAGYAVHRLNMRGCGGSEHLTDTLYHSGLTQDTRSILEHFRDAGRGPRCLIGFSLGGNVTLKLAGELDEAGPGLISKVVAVSTPMDLHACVRRLDSLDNWIYEQRFVRGLCNRYRRRHATQPERFPLRGIDRIRTVFDFDDQFTAKAFGFGDAPNYYATQSAIRFVSRIRIPTLLVQAADDPLIPFEIYETKQVAENPNLKLIVTEHGGHLGFISRQNPRFWLDALIRDWLD
jgi:uncharacterized protein